MDAKDIKKQPDYVFEVSWEVCNKVGGIYTVISTKAILMQKAYGDNFIMIGPDLYKGPSGNSDFIEDIELFKDWKEKLNIDGLKLRIGRWNIPSRSIVILIDFSPLFTKKDHIFSELWAKNQLDSLRGGWDYIEPALFGYGAGKIIESFKSFFLHHDTLIIAHFHEWMTGAGILYLENNAPEIATVFTTHATVTGRSLCGNGFPFYSKFETYNGDQEAKNFNILSKHSLEKTAATLADAFTTVSPNAALECQQLLSKAVDMVTINGFDDSFVPDEHSFQLKHSSAKEKLLRVASAVMGYPAHNDSLLVATSGRYEYRNKGIDLFIDALKALNSKEGMTRDIIAFILVPAAHTCSKKEVLNGLRSGNFEKSKEQSVLTHYLQNPDNDSIWQQIKNSTLLNDIEHKVKVIFSPIYLDGKDEIFSLSYYDLLIGFDLTVFASYYEPFGYTPLESLAFHVPTVTTTLTGFGQDVKSTMPNHKEGILVIERSDFNDRTVMEQIANHIYKFSIKDKRDIDKARKEAFEISRFYLWKNLIRHYDDAYKVALDRYSLRLHALKHLLEIEPDTSMELADSNEPIWKSAMVQYKVPETLQDLDILSRNLWWTWHYEAERLFSSIDTKLWEQVNHNPIALLGSLTYKRFLELEKDKEFITNLTKITDEFKTYLAQGSKKSKPMIAYICMEYGLHESLPLYSGGLGILAGDYLKEASDKNIDIVAFGLLYRYGYFNQSLTLQGEQIAQYEKQHFTQLAIEPVRDQEGNRLIMQIPFRGPIIMVQVWKVQVGRIPLYLFDTDIPQNGEQNRKITHYLYGGNKEYRFQQELVLALSTLQLMETLAIMPDLYHYNEGHTAFTSLFRILRAVTQKNLSFEEARQFVSASTLFTTHTPVPAGQDSFSEDLLRSYQSHFSETLNISWNRLLGLGKINIRDSNEDFSMTNLAARLSGEINAVSRIHAKVTRNMFKPLWKGILEEELQIDYINNGVHYATWTAPLWQQLFAETFGNSFSEDLSNVKYWSLSNLILSSKIVSIKKALKTDLIKGIQDKLKRDMKSLHQSPKYVYEMLNSLTENDLIIGFARRFTTYKRAGLLFENLDRLSKLVNNPLKPVKFIFAGKAHPADKSGQDLIKKIIEISARPEFFGKILFIQNYDMALAKLLVQGVDLWVNTPQRGNESSGTSGMKATLNGTLNFSVMDGWWAEAYREDAGWALPEEQIFKSENDQDEIDAEMIYNILEHEIILEYFDVDKLGVSERWVQRIKKAFTHIAPKFTTTRMMDGYQEKYYSKMYDYVQVLKKDDYAATRQIVNWSNNINMAWPNISVVEVQFSNGKKPLELGDKFVAEITLELNGLAPEDIKVELVFVKKYEDNYYKIRSVEELKLIDNKQNQAVYRGEATAAISGAFQYDIHFFPKNPLLKCRRNLPLVKWI